MLRSRVRIGSAIAIAGALVAGSAMADGAASARVARPLAASQVWVRELGTTGSDGAFGVAANTAGTTYVAGEASGRLPGAPDTYAGSIDAFVAKYSSTATRLWVRELGSTSEDHGRGAALDGSGNVYITGYTSGRLPGSPDAPAGLEDAFVAKYSPTGTRLWVRQLGSSSSDFAFGVAAEKAGDVYITGYTLGTLPGSPEPHAGLEDTFIAKYSSTGTLLWVHQLGTSALDKGKGVGVDAAGNAYIAGNTDGQLPGSTDAPAGGRDVFMAKYSPTGARLWVHELGSTVFDGADGITVNGTGNAYLAGGTWGNLPGSPDAARGNGDAFVVKYSSAGTKLWVRQLGTSTTDWAFGVAVDGPGNTYIAGYSYGRLPGSPDPAKGVDDAYVAKYSPTGHAAVRPPARRHDPRQRQWGGGRRGCQCLLRRRHPGPASRIPGGTSRIMGRLRRQVLVFVAPGPARPVESGVPGTSARRAGDGNRTRVLSLGS